MYLSPRSSAEVLSIPYTQLNEILNGKRPVTTDFALMMEAALGINPELLTNMQMRYNMSMARQKRTCPPTIQRNQILLSLLDLGVSLRQLFRLIGVIYGVINLLNKRIYKSDQRTVP